MKKFFLIVFLLPLFSEAQKLPDNGFNKVRISQIDKTVQAELLPVTFQPAIKPDLFYYWYGANIIHITQGGFSGKLLNGIYREYYLSKNLKEQGVFAKGLKNGTWKTWNENGNLISLYIWNNGVKSGIFNLYNEQGRLIQSGRYNDNLLDGQVKHYKGSDTVTVVQYRKGKVFTDTSRSFLQKLNLFKKKDHRLKNTKDSLQTH